jgi:hypothetical protein
LQYIFDFILAILLTGLSYYVGSVITRKGIAMWKAAFIGFSVVSLGALTEALGAPIWLIILIPFTVGMGLLYLFLKVNFSKWFLTYAITLSLYTIIHINMSYFFQFNSLIPAWKLS